MIKRLLDSGFARNVALVATGTAGAQAITMAFSPVITRLYGPEAFGLLGTFTAALAIATPVAGLTYPIAIVLPKDDNDARGVAMLSLGLAFAISLVVAAVFLLGDQAIAAILGLEAIAPYLLLIPLAMFFNVMQQIMQQWLIRKKQFKVSARIAITQSLILNSSKAGVGLVHPAGAALIVLATLGNALYALQLWLGAKRWTQPNDHISRREGVFPALGSVAYKHRDFALYRAPQVTINAVSQSLPVLILASYFGPATAGLYTLSRSVMTAPAHLLGNSIGNVFYAKIAEVVNTGDDPRPYLYKATAGAFAVALVPFSIIIVWGAPIFSFIFGSQWYVAGQYAQWVAVWLLFSLTARPVIATIPAVNLQGTFLTIEILFTALKLIGFLVGAIAYNSALVSIAIYCIVSCMLYIVLFIVTGKHLSKVNAYEVPAAR